jgi:hypothetical protein
MPIPGVLASNKSSHISKPFTASILIVGGGGTSGIGGGGGGGLATISFSGSTGINYTITVGNTHGNSTFNTTTASGGNNSSGINGGSSGSSVSTPRYAGGAGQSAYGNAGGGGGGAGNIGSDGTSQLNIHGQPIVVGGDGGSGVYSSITGTSQIYGGGGGGSPGGANSTSVYGGGGGVGTPAQQGVVIISVSNTYTGLPVSSLAYTKTTNGNNYVFTFTGIGTGTVNF